MVEALFQAIAVFEKNGIDYCLIGGLAIMLHNGRANTVDIDFYVVVNDLHQVKDSFQKEGFTVDSRGEFQVQALVKGIRIDILLADHYLGADVVHRAIDKKLGDRFVRIATPEDLIVLKTLADRAIDRRDIEELREIYGATLDENYIIHKVKHIKTMMKE